jgi:CspA family cold shock protein
MSRPLSRAGTQDDSQASWSLRESSDWRTVSLCCLDIWSVVMPTGTVKWFNSQKGYGFIQPQGGGGRDVFVHISAVEKAGLTGLNEGQIVQYEEVSNKGKTSAENLKVK